MSEAAAVETPESHSASEAEAPAPVTEAKPEAPKGVPDGADPAEWARSEVTKARKEAANVRARLKEAESKAQQFDELQESQKSELQKAQEAAARAQKELDDARQEALRLKVASQKGLPDTLAARLQGGTLEEMEADADAILADLGSRYLPKQGASQQATGAGVTGKPALDDLSPADFVKMTKERRGS